MIFSAVRLPGVERNQKWNLFGNMILLIIQQQQLALLAEDQPKAILHNQN